MTHLLLTVGKAKADYARLGLEHFAGRLKPYGGCRLAAVRPARATKGSPPAQLMAAEGERLLAALKPRDLVWALDRQAKAWSSEQWARRLERARAGPSPRLVLVVGGHLGLDPRVLARADERISLGRATLPHEMAALVGLEQLYRACTILAGSPYHRA